MAKRSPFDAFEALLKTRDMIDAITRVPDAMKALTDEPRWSRDLEEITRRVEQIAGADALAANADRLAAARRTAEALGIAAGPSPAMLEQMESVRRATDALGVRDIGADMLAANADQFAAVPRTVEALGGGVTRIGADMMRAAEAAVRAIRELGESPAFSALRSINSPVLAGFGPGLGVGNGAVLDSLGASINVGSSSVLESLGASINVGNGSVLESIGKAAISADAWERLQEWAARHAETVPPIGSLSPEAVDVTLDDDGAAAWEKFHSKAEAIASGESTTAEDVVQLSQAGHAVIASAGTPADRISMARVIEATIAGLILNFAYAGPPPWLLDVIKTLMVVLWTLTPPADPKTPVLFVPDRTAIAARAQYDGPPVPKVIAAAGDRARKRFVEFFTAHIRNENTRAAYMRAVGQFCTWLDEWEIELHEVQPVIVAMYIEQLQRTESAPTTKQALSAIRMMFDYLVIGQVLPFNPAASVRGPKHVVKRGKTPVLSDDQTRQLLDSIDGTNLIDLRDRALIGVMAYSFARVSATTSMKVRDYYKNGKRWAFRLHEKGGKVHEVPAHHKAEEYLDAYVAAAGIEDDPKGPLFRSFAGRTGVLQRRSMHRNDVLRMIYRRAKAVDLDARVCCHTFRATGITNYLSNGGTLERAQQIADHSSPRTTKLYGRTNDELTLDEIERIRY